MEKKQRGRPRSDPAKTKSQPVQIRMEAAEKHAFNAAAELAGLSLSAWMRERLRLAARDELAKNGRVASFLKEKTPQRRNR